MSWSSGKDSAWILHILRQNPMIEIIGMFTGVSEKYNRASMHATRLEMLERQADATGLPLQTIHLPDPCTNEQYDGIMRKFVDKSVAKGVECMAFGDLFLEDIRKYRENRLKGTGIEPIFPLWSTPTGELAEQMLSAGLEAFVGSVDLKKLPSDIAGQKWTKDLLKEFPEGIDPCGENGEIHTVVVGGPMFRRTIAVSVGGIVKRDGFAYADIIPID